MSKVAIVAGSSGLVGTELLLQLCSNKSYASILLLVRRPSGFIHAKVRELIVDFDHLDRDAGAIQGDIVFCCLGSTRKKTPDKRRYYQIDHDYPVQLAKLALANGASEFHLISAIGANSSSSNFYLKMKGETELDVAALPFRSVHLYRPSFLAGQRDERRILEKIGLAFFKIINPIMGGGLKKYRSISVRDVAKTMITQSLKMTSGIHIYESDQIQRIADEGADLVRS